MKKLYFLCALLFATAALQAQTLTTKGLISGPMLGYVEHREALVWLEVGSDIRSVMLSVRQKGRPETSRIVRYKGSLQNAYNPIKITIEGLEMDKEYEYDLFLNEKKWPTALPTAFKTRRLWEWREPAPDFSFMLGSCFYINDPLYDRPGKPYGQDPRILETMGNIATDFMLWMGDNTYLREADYSSRAGIAYRYSYNFRLPQMQKLRASRPNFALWDDHDYGPNDSDGKYELKEFALDIFKQYWGNKTFGEPENPGTYHKFKWSDCDFFCMDDRFYRSANNLPDSIDGKPNANKQFYGKKQLEWLKNSLVASNATFKFIVTGGQMLNKMADKECFVHYPAEYQELMQFIVENKIEGIVFLSGDRHFSELIKWQPKDFYTMYDFTCSAVSSGVFNVLKSEEAVNPQRVEGSLLVANNFGTIQVSGEKGKRVLTMNTFDIDGQKKWSYTLKAEDLKIK